MVDHSFLINLHKILHFHKDEQLRMSVLCFLWHYVKRQGTNLIETKVSSELVRGLSSVVTSQEEKTLKATLSYMNAIISNSESFSSIFPVFFFETKHLVEHIRKHWEIVHRIRHNHYFSCTGGDATTFQ